MLKTFSSLRHQAVWLAALCALFLWVQPTDARPPAPLKKVIVIGTGTLYKGNSAAARQAAINDGLNAALDAAVVELLSPESLVGHFQSINRVILGKTDNFIQGYKVLGEYKDGKKYRAVVEATISLDAISRKLAAVSVAVGSGELPKVLFFISQQNPAGTAPIYWWGGDAQFKMTLAEREMAVIMSKRGFLAADPGRSRSGPKNRNIDFPTNIDTASALLLAADYGARVVVIGSAIVDPVSNTMGASRRSYAATVKARAVKVADGSQLGVIEKQAVAAGSDDIEGGRQAIKVAAGLAAEALSGKIITAWGRGGQSLTTLKIAVEGTRDLANFVMFRRVIKKMPSVEKVRTLEMKPDQATIQVEYQGSAEAFANGLMLNSFENFRLDIYEVAGGVLRVALIPR